MSVLNRSSLKAEHEYKPRRALAQENEPTMSSNPLIPPYSSLPQTGERQIEIEEGEIAMLNAPQRSLTPLPIPILEDTMANIPPPHHATRDIHVMAMWSTSHISRYLGMEEWSVFSVSDPIHLETAHDENDPYQLRYGDSFILKLYNQEGSKKIYMRLRVLAIIDSDSPFFMLFSTWSTRNSETLFRIPINFISTTVDTLLCHIDKTTLLTPGIEVSPTIIFTDSETRTENAGRRFINTASRLSLDPDGIMDQYILLVQDM
ncbi:hypothetical protein H0H93_008487 [Arthromyces matolae]|nr:hypothetical protein H0H93_008487 [Arthromyces matolae]